MCSNFSAQTQQKIVLAEFSDIIRHAEFYKTFNSHAIRISKRLVYFGGFLVINLTQIQLPVTLTSLRMSSSLSEDKRSFYEILGVSKTDSVDVIKKGCFMFHINIILLCLIHCLLLLEILALFISLSLTHIQHIAFSLSFSVSVLDI